jgi:dephospho-CoA kinase
VDSVGVDQRIVIHRAVIHQTVFSSAENRLVAAELRDPSLRSRMTRAEVTAAARFWGSFLAVGHRSLEMVVCWMSARWMTASTA